MRNSFCWLIFSGITNLVSFSLLFFFLFSPNSPEYFFKSPQVKRTDFYYSKFTGPGFIPEWFPAHKRVRDLNFPDSTAFEWLQNYWDPRKRSRARKAVNLFYKLLGDLQVHYKSVYFTLPIQQFPYVYSQKIFSMKKFSTPFLKISMQKIFILGQRKNKLLYTCSIWNFSLYLRWLVLLPLSDTVLKVLKDKVCKSFEHHFCMS